MILLTNDVVKQTTSILKMIFIYELYNLSIILLLFNRNNFLNKKNLPDPFQAKIGITSSKKLMRKSKIIFTNLFLLYWLTFLASDYTSILKFFK